MHADLTAAASFDPTPWVAQGRRPGAIVAVLSGGEVMSWSSRGRVSVGEDDGPLTPETVFYVASVSKQFTAACVAVCEMDGLIDVDASIRIWLPTLPLHFQPITPRLLIHHVGGLPPGPEQLVHAPGPPNQWWRDLGLWDLVEVLSKEERLMWPPGSRYSYANTGYWLLAAIVERASGQTLGAFARERLFAPLGMTMTRFREDPDEPQPTLAPGHLFADGAYHPVRTRFHGVGDGGLLTSIEDLAKWDLFWSGRSILGRELPSRLLDRGRLNGGARLYYAWGVTARTHRGVRIISHGGRFIGYLSKLVRFPDQDLSLACLANTEDIDVDKLTMSLADLVLGNIVDPTAPSWADTLRDDALDVGTNDFRGV